MNSRPSRVVARVKAVNETVQLRLGTAVSIIYIAAVSLVGIEVLAILLESSLIIPFAAPLAPLIVIALGTFAILRRRAIRRRAGRTIASNHVARGSRMRTRTASRAPRNATGGELASRHP